MKSYEEKIYKNPLEQLKNAEQELQDLKQQKTIFLRKSEKFASRVMFAAFSMAAA